MSKPVQTPDFSRPDRQRFAIGFHSCWLLLLLALLFCSTLVSAEPAEPLVTAGVKNSPQASVELDQQMATALEAMIGGDIDAATQVARSIAERYPNFALAQLLSGELQALAALDPLQVSTQYDWSPRLVNLLLEARRRLEQTAKPDSDDHVPASIIQAGLQGDEVLLVDISDSTLYRYENRDGKLHLKHKHYVSSGRGGAGKQLEGDLKTPIGLYRITDSLIDAELPPLYGHGALVLNYPNALDRRLGRTGHGIWLHGNPTGQISRAPYSSEGCVTMTNEHVAVLMNELPLTSTQVVLSESVRWRTHSKAAAARKAWQKRFNTWRDAWLDSDVATLNRLYDPEFRPNALDLHTLETSVEHVSNQASRTMKDAPVRPLLEEKVWTHLAAIQAESVSILENPHKRGDPATGRHVRMSLPNDSEFSGSETILWWALDEDRQWRIVAEERSVPAL